MPSPQQEWAGDLADTIEELAYNRIRPAKHLVARLVALLYPAKPVFVDASITIDGATADGHVVVFTDSLVALATFERLKSMSRSDDPHADSKAAVEVFARNTLERVEVAELDGDYAWNTTPEWQTQTGDLSYWPSGGRVALHYRGRPQSIVVPSALKPQGFDDFLPELMGDLSR